MARGNPDNATLQMALVGYEIERRKIEEKIREIEQQLGHRRAKTPAASPAKEGLGPKRILSAAARKRIAMAQKKRWAEHRKAKAQARGE